MIAVTDGEAESIQREGYTIINLYKLKQKNAKSKANQPYAKFCRPSSAAAMLRNKIASQTHLLGSQSGGVLEGYSKKRALAPFASQ